ncbi:MAG: acetyl-CoA C-acetyltransferase [Gammaproteobacteria bacterium]|jgi:acetyl-CoA C-acetyltransferase|nr:acetyl-CoA C-acetyltransferase [Gammaproteobacteria bacterium]MDA8953280.1 acetyl-CoA C-acetyltransferase [Pseudomonadales bacterium]MBT3695741.1 acetyl-CoA C-acetyltransferase [Gammaproteobacteria bacterium]MBT5332541.1 acetyl-CoA C-acetyltransferase [Gammaproteobacteria bacterium]MBT5683033.1 acetyl-CoA C-acetyltransferase [Gammaproteobacteria bacterium]
MTDAYIIDAARTPRGIGKAGKGSLSEFHPSRLLAKVFEGIQSRNDLNTADIDDVVVGCSSQVGKQGSCVGRMAALDAGWDTSASAVTLDRFCGSGITSVNLAAANIMSGMDDLCVAGGVEMMSYTATLTPEYGNRTVDGGNLHLRDLHPQPHQGVCADMIATLDNFSREELDALAVESQIRAQHAVANGYFDKSVIPVFNDDGTLALDREEFPRPGTTMETLAALPTVFSQFMDAPVDNGGETFRQLVARKYPDLDINHVHHAGNSSGVVDGAAALILSNKAYADKVGWKPRARIISMATVGGDPTLMLNEPVPAARKALARVGMTVDDIDLFEINEAFSVVAAKFIRDLGLDPAKVNVNGGAMALGHPIAATGSILIGTMLDELERRDLSTGLITMCTGGGMAPAIIIERV